MSAPLDIVTDSGDLAQQIAFRTRRTDVVTMFVGQVTDVTDGIVTIDINGLEQTAPLVGAPLDVGDNVLVARRGTGRGALLYAITPMLPANLPIQGTVASVPTNSYVLPVTTVIGTISANFPSSYTPAVGDTVYLGWEGTQAIVLGSQGKTGTPPPPTPKPRPPTPTPPPARPVSGVSAFPASSSGTWRSGDGWRDDANGNVIQGTAPGVGGANNGVWFYGGRPSASLAGAQITKAQIYLGRTQGGNYGKQTVRLQRVTQNKRPTGNVTYAGAVATVGLDVGDKGWFTIPAALAQAVVDSGGSIGVQATSGPYVRLLGLPNSGTAGALRLTWSKSA